MEIGNPIGKFDFSLHYLFITCNKRVTKDNRKNPEYHVVAMIRRLRIDKNCPAEKLWLNERK